MIRPGGLSDSGLDPLSASRRPLVDRYDVALFDLDGVVYVGRDPVPGAPAHLEHARHCGVRVVFVTNNASRTPETVADHLTGLGVKATAADVVTAAQAAAGLVAERVPAGSKVLVVGGDGLVVAIRERGLVPVSTAAEDPAAVVQGFHPDVGWRQLAEGAYALAHGLPWVASNADLTLPTEHGIAPGNGALIETLRLATGRTPVVAGKPEPPLLVEAVRRAGGRHALVVGDRLDTDIEGANAAGLPSLLVLTGVTGLRQLAAAPPALRPTYVSADLGGLFSPHAAPAVARHRAACGDWVADVRAGAAVLEGSGAFDDGVRAVAAAVWTADDPASVEVSEAVERLGSLAQTSGRAPATPALEEGEDALGSWHGGDR